MVQWFSPGFPACIQRSRPVSQAASYWMLAWAGEYKTCLVLQAGSILSHSWILLCLIVIHRQTSIWNRTIHSFQSFEKQKWLLSNHFFRYNNYCVLGIYSTLYTWLLHTAEIIFLELQYYFTIARLKKYPSPQSSHVGTPVLINYCWSNDMLPPQFSLTRLTQQWFITITDESNALILF